MTIAAGAYLNASSVGDLTSELSTPGLGTADYQCGSATLIRVSRSRTLGGAVSCGISMQPLLIGIVHVGR